jgi:hypothetical protein
MKLLKLIYINAGIVLFSLCYLSCENDETVLVADIQTDFSNKAQVQVYNAIVGATRNYVYVDAAAVMGASFAYGGVFPVTPSNFSVKEGLRSFLVRDTATVTTQVPLSFGEVLMGKSYYTIFLYDTITSPKQKTVSNSIVIPSDTTSRVRFASFAYSPNAIPALDVYSARKGAVIFSNVQHTNVTNYIPYYSNYSDTLYLRLAGSSTNLTNKTSTGATTDFRLILTPIQKRSYTVILRGGWRSEYTNIATVRTLSVFSSN